MTDSKNLCMNCMSEMPEGVVNCPDCNYNNNSPQKAPFLKKETIIFNRYIVGKVQTFAEDSITYIGYDKSTDNIVDIIEFFPSNIVSRPEASNDVSIKLGYETVYKDYLQSFLNLWNTLKELNAIMCLPQVIEVIDSNCTVYAITKHKDCISLKEYFKDKTTPLTWKRTHYAFTNVVNALSKLHDLGIVHGNISPESVFVGSDGKINLGRFSIKECMDTSSHIRTAPIPGFSPLEAYPVPSSVDTYSDVYSMTAMLYYCITGIIPPAATERLQKDNLVMPNNVARTLSKKEIETFVKGLSLRSNNRLQNAGVLYSALYENQPVVPTKKQPVKPAQPVQKKKQPTQATKPAKQSKPKAKTNNDSIAGLVIKTFATVIIAFSLLFSTLYGTFLYKNHNIEFMNKVLAPFAFLPINSNNTAEPDEPVVENTTQATTASYERAYVTVPDFTTQTIDSIKSNATYNTNFTIKFKYENSVEFEKGTVISQSLPIGESVPSGSEITIKISEGPLQIELPDVIGKDYKTAASELKEKGFKVKKEVAENDGSQTADEVYMMSKVAGLEFDKGTEIVLYVWDEIPETTTEETTTEATTKKKTDKEKTTKKQETTTKKATTTKAETE